MSILENFDVDPETKRVLRIALERTRMSLGLTDGLADGIIANQIIEFAKAGERNPDLLCEGALKKLREPVRRLNRGQHTRRSNVRFRQALAARVSDPPPSRRDRTAWPCVLSMAKRSISCLDFLSSRVGEQEDSEAARG